MRIGFDYYRTLTEHAGMIRLLKSLQKDNEVMVISAYGDKQAAKGDYMNVLMDFLKDNHIENVAIEAVHFNDVLDIPNLKLEACLRNKIDIYFDDRMDVCLKLKENGILALNYPRDLRK